MNSKQRRTLNAIYEEPTRADIEWSAIETLLRSLGTTIEEGSGSRVRFAWNGVRAVFHRPHPERVTDRGAVKSVRLFLQNAGIEVEEDA